MSVLPQPLTPDLSLAPLAPVHARELFDLVDSNRGHLRRWLPWVDSTRSVADIEKFIRRTQEQAEENQGVQTALLHRGEIAGVIGQRGVDRANRSTSLGYWLAEGYQGRGLMSQACGAYLRHAFETQGLHRIEIRAAVANRRSRAIPERLGFALEGTIRHAEWINDHFVDHAVYGLLEGEWRRSHEAPATGAPSRPSRA